MLLSWWDYQENIECFVLIKCSKEHTVQVISQAKCLFIVSYFSSSISFPLVICKDHMTCTSVTLCVTCATWCLCMFPRTLWIETDRCEENCIAHSFNYFCHLKNYNEKLVMFLDTDSVLRYVSHISDPLGSSDLKSRMTNSISWNFAPQNLVIQTW